MKIGPVRFICIYMETLINITKTSLLVTNNIQLFCLFVCTNQLYMFREMFSPIIRSTWLYLQLLI